MTVDAVAWLTGELRRATKYRFVCGEALERFAARALARYRTRTAALDAAKRKLHQAFGAYAGGDAYGRAATLLAGWPARLSGEALSAACADVLMCHASTAERLPNAVELYRWIFADLPAPRRVTDLACGLHPFAVPLMGLPAGCRYLAVDLDERLPELVAALAGRTGSACAARCADLLADSLRVEADVVLLMKTATCLERQETGAVRRLLDRLAAPAVVVTFPTRSLGGRDVGMPAKYRADWRPVFTDAGFRVEELELPTELAFRLRR